MKISAACTLLCFLCAPCCGGAAHSILGRESSAVSRITVTIPPRMPVIGAEVQVSGRIVATCTLSNGQTCSADEQPVLATECRLVKSDTICILTVIYNGNSQ